MPNPKSPILILSGPVRSGKTTALFEAFATARNVGGFLTPDRDGRRMLYDISDGTWYPFELPPDAEEEAIEVGKFRFAKNTFTRAKKMLETETPLCIVDEVGKLEILHHTGLEPELSALIDKYQRGEKDGILLLVIRDTLLAQALRKYGLEAAPAGISLEALGLENGPDMLL